jgi:hypothetical protein
MHKWYHWCSDCAIPMGDGTAAAAAGFALVPVEQSDHVPRDVPRAVGHGDRAGRV